jgi:hypothetical protein
MGFVKKRFLPTPGTFLCDKNEKADFYNLFWVIGEKSFQNPYVNVKKKEAPNDFFTG